MTAIASPILVVDDDADHRTLLTTYLTADGYSVAEAGSGEAALEFIAHTPVALVLLDVMLPGLSGFDVCRRLKRDPHTAATPVVMVTALGDATSRTRAFDSDADEFIAKPVFRLELLARVRALLRLRRTQIDKEAALGALEAQQGGQLQDLLGRYLPRPVVEHLMQLPAGERDALLQSVLNAAVPELLQAQRPPTRDR
ncbi:MAG: response regulator [Nevskiaceae bacterium]